jgi:capsular exopolysaccharide synthesis family protein
MHDEMASAGHSRDTAAGPFDGLVDVWALVNRRRMLITSAVVVCVALAVVVRFLLPIKYEASGVILVQKKDANLAAEGVESRGEFEGKLVEDILATHMVILTSPKIVSSALEKNNLAHLDSVTSALNADQDAVDYVVDNLTISRGGTGQAKAAHVLTLSIRHNSADDAAKLLTAVFESYQAFVAETYQDVGKEAATLIDQARGEIGEELKQKQVALRESRETAPLLWKGEEALNVHQNRINQHETDLAALKLRQAHIESRLEVIQERLQPRDSQQLTDLDRMALISDEDSERLSRLAGVEKGSSLTEAFQAEQPARMQMASLRFENLVSLKTELNVLEEKYGPNQRQVKEKREAIRALEAVLAQQSTQLGVGGTEGQVNAADLLDAYIGLLTNDLNDMQQTRRVLEELIAQETRSAKELLRYELQDESLRSDIARLQSLYETVVDRLGSVNLAKDYGGFSPAVLRPVEPGKPVKASLPLAIFMGGLLGLLFGGGAAFAVDVGDKSFRGPEQIRSVLGAPILAHVPLLDVAYRESDDADSEEIDSRVLCYLQPRSRDAELFRALRTELCFGDHKNARRVLQVTSPNPGDGRSVLTANLAASLAQSGKSVLLVDCDLRRPAVQDLFCAVTTEGLSTLLTSDVDLPDVIQPTAVENLWVLPSGPLPANPAELLASTRFEQFIELVRNQYDFVLLDSSPLLLVSDPSVIAPRADGVLFVLRLTPDCREDALRAKKKLASVGANIVGLVVNCADKKGRRFYGTSLDDHIEFHGSRYEEYYSETGNMVGV